MQFITATLKSLGKINKLKMKTKLKETRTFPINRFTIIICLLYHPFYFDEEEKKNYNIFAFAFDALYDLQLKQFLKMHPQRMYKLV